MKLKITLALILFGIVVQAQSSKHPVLKPGKVISNFAITLVNGEKSNILDIAGKSKYTLIDFWASWCVPCRNEFPKLRQVFTTYNKNGFNILGLANDNDASWKKAIGEDQTPWQHCRDIGEVIFKQFGILAIPSYLLIDNEGKIIAASVTTMSGTIEFGPSIADGEKIATTIKNLVAKPVN